LNIAGRDALMGILQSTFRNAIGWLGFGDVSTEFLQADRHRRLSVAVPFPEDLSWCNKVDIEKSLRSLHDFAVRVANSAIDWYGRKRTWKRFWARTVHLLAYLFGVVGVAVPLLTILPPLREWMRLGPEVTADHAAEFALVLLGFAGGISVLDRVIGLTSGWMSYVSTSMQINHELTEFEFEWSELEMKASAAREAAKVKESVPTQENTGERTCAPPPVPQGCKCACPTDDDFKLARIELARTFCLRVLEIVRQETSGWADELKKNVSQLSDQLSRHPRN
jgi:hypothetical protein